MNAPTQSLVSISDRPRTTKSSISGLLLAGVTALVSGIAVFVNSYGVKSYADATAYTTAKNAVAAIVLCSVLVFSWARSRQTGRATAPPTEPNERRRHWIRWVRASSIAIIGGSVPFVLFFEGLARASAKDAAFIHKTLVVWVAILAMVFLRERVGWLQVAAIALLVSGQWMLGFNYEALRLGNGELLIAGATLLWSVEVVMVKRLLGSFDASSLAVVRMGGGVVVLVGWLVLTGRLGALWPTSGDAARWVVATGLLLGMYVISWYEALVRARAIDVTAVLTLAVPVTAILDATIKGTPLAPQTAGLLAVAAGVVLVTVAALAGRSPSTATTTAA
ncbi:MAG: DMT family transporter [Acidimicrobiales bacterium]|nr:DMT family transporter [Acidimicrobiales bacterium]